MQVVIPDAAKRRSGIHNPGLSVLETQGLWIPGSSRLRPSGYGGRPGMTEERLGLAAQFFLLPSVLLGALPPYCAL